MTIGCFFDTTPDPGRRRALAALAGACLAPAGAAREVLAAGCRPGHPRLLFGASVEQELRGRGARDRLLARLLEAARARSDRFAAEGPAPFHATPHEEFGIHMLELSRAVLARVCSHGLMYRLTGLDRYAERLRAELEAALAYPTWNPAHFLDAAEMMTAVAFAYDWAYDRLTPELRARVRTALKERALQRGMEIHAQRTGLSSSFPATTSNWNAVCNVGMLAGALAMAEDEPELADAVLARVLPSLANARKGYEPDGASEEGPTYWGYGSDYLALGAAMMESAFGSDGGLLDGDGVRRTVHYRLHAQGPGGRNFTYADCWPRTGSSVGYAYLAQRFGTAPARQHLRDLLAEDVATPMADSGFRLAPLAALWLPPQQAPDAFEGAALAAMFRGRAQLFMARSAWGDRGAAYLGFKAGHVDHGHNHLDLGSFVFDSAGVRWSTDLGPDSYALPGYFRKEGSARAPLTPASAHLPHRWSYLRTTNHGHSTLTLGGDLQDRAAVGPILRHGDAARLAFAHADLSAAYPGRARTWQRGVALVRRRWLAVRDELDGLEAGVRVEWAMMTEAEVSVDANGRAATLHKDGTRMRLMVAAAPSGARLGVAPAAPLSERDSPNPGVSRIVLRWEADHADAVIEMHLYPAQERRPALLGALAAWR